MKQLFSLAFLLILTKVSLSQNSNLPDSLNHKVDSSMLINGKEIVFNKTEVEAQFPGGDAAWIDYLKKNINPNTPVNNGIRRSGTYRIIVRFIVWNDGTIRDVVAETKYGFGMEQEATRIIRNGPNWIPAYQNGRKVNAYRRQPVIFVVN